MKTLTNLVKTVLCVAFLIVLLATTELFRTNGLWVSLVAAYALGSLLMLRILPWGREDPRAAKFRRWASIGGFSLGFLLLLFLAAGEAQFKRVEISPQGLSERTRGKASMPAAPASAN